MTDFYMLLSSNAFFLTLNIWVKSITISLVNIFLTLAIIFSTPITTSLDYYKVIACYLLLTFEFTYLLYSKNW